MRSVFSAIGRHRGAATLGLLGLVALVGGFVVFANLPGDAPAMATASLYDNLDQHRAIRSDVRGEESPPSVRSREVMPTPTPVNQRFESAVARIRITRIGVDASVVTMGLLPDGTMESPPKPELVAWYGFTTKPGMGGNAVLSGHLDYRNYGPAVFANLKKLVAGDVIEIVLADGTVIKYEVTGVKQYPVELVPMREVLAQTADESLTLITCGGAFGGVSYSDRLVLRAVKTGVSRTS